MSILPISPLGIARPSVRGLARRIGSRGQPPPAPRAELIVLRREGDDMVVIRHAPAGGRSVLRLHRPR